MAGELPPLPAGFTLDQPSSGMPPLPPGFTLDSEEQAQAPEPTITSRRPLIMTNPITAPFMALGEQALTGITSGIGSLAEAATGADPGSISSRTAYRPRTDVGRVMEFVGSKAAPAFSAGYDKVMGTGPLAQTLKERVPQALGAVGVVAPLKPSLKMASNTFKRAPLMSAEEVLAKSAGGTAQNMGAAAASQQLTAVSQPLREAIAKAGNAGKQIDQEVVSRHVRGESLPVPVRYTEGQATQDPSVLSMERNLRGRHKELADRFSEQNTALKENVYAIRDEIGPDVFTTDNVGHGQKLIDAYKALDEGAQRVISKKYKDLADANGGDLPVDGRTFLKTASEKLKKENKGRFLPPAVRRMLADVSKTQRNAMDPVTLNITSKPTMTFGQFENLRTILAAESRTAERAGKGNTVGAIAIVRDALESMPLSGEAAALKPLADAARSASRARFDALRSDPAYNAAIKGKSKPDLFLRQYVINGNPAEVTKLMKAISGDPVATQTVRVAVMDYLRDAAKAGPYDSGNFATASYNRALRSLDPRLRLLLDARTADQLHQLSDVARDVTGQPAGAFVNNSNTFTAAAADRAAGALEATVNAFTGGIGGTVARRAVGNAKANARIRKSLEPGAGIVRE